MQSLSMLIQSQEDNAGLFDDLLHLIKSIGRHPEIDKDPATGMVALNFFSENVALLWEQLNQNVLQSAELGGWLQTVCIVVCEAPDGGEDELLLYHFDKNERLDALGSEPS